MRLDPNYGESYHARGRYWAFRSQLDRAIADITQAIRLDPENISFYCSRSHVHDTNCEFEKAIAEYSEVIRRNPDFAEACNSRAWIWATCPDAGLRDGRKAVDSAARACELTGWEEARIIDTLAAA